MADGSEWKLRDGAWHRGDGVRLTRHGHEDDWETLWRATRPLPDAAGRSVFDVGADNVFLAMDMVDETWPLVG
jgi:hypothetical protein